MFFNRSYTIKNIRKHIVGIDSWVPVINGKKVRYINFDNAASTPTLYPILDKVNDFMSWYSSIHRGTGYKSKVSTKAYDKAHDIVLDFVHGDPHKHTVIFTKNTTEAINKLSYRLNLSKDDIVLTTLMEHHSNDLPWRGKAQVKHVGLSEDGCLDLKDLENNLKRYKNKVKLVTVTGASNVTGFINDIHRIAEMVHSYHGKVMVDAAQLAPHRAINIMGHNGKDYIDYMVFSAHKMYAPFGIGVLIGDKTTFQQGTPEYVGGGTIKSVTQYNSFWADLPDKEEAGTPNVVGAIALAESIKILNEVGMEAIKNHEKDLTRHAIARLKELKDIEIFSCKDIALAHDSVGVISFNAKGIHHNLLASALSYEAGIGIRSGCFCAHPYIHKLLNMSSLEISRLQQDLVLERNNLVPGLIRVSFGLYNTTEEIDRFICALEKMVIERKVLETSYIFDASTGEFEPKKLPKNHYVDVL